MNAPDLAAPAPPAAPADHLETEWQFDAPSLARVRRWLGADVERFGCALAPAGVAAIVDTYHDTEDWRLYRAGFALRVRRVQDRVEATLKARTPPEGGLARRREINEALPDATALARATGPVGGRVRLVAGRAPLGTLFTVRTRRETFALVRDGARIGDVTLDTSAIGEERGPAAARIHRVEVEVHDVPTAVVAPFVAALAGATGLRPSRRSKFATGLTVRGLVPTPAPRLGATAIDGAQPIGELAFAALRPPAAAMLAVEPGTRLGEDPEALHDMRVAARRLRAAFKIFAPYLPARAERLRRELDWANGALGALRDLDVQLGALAEQAPALSLSEQSARHLVRETLVARRQAARAELLAVLESERWERFVARLVEFLRRAPLRRDRGARRAARAVLPRLLRKRHRRVVRFAARLEGAPAPAVLHELRIRVRRLRYALESVADLYGTPLKRLVRALVDLQDVLGAHQDAVVAEAQLRALVRESGTLDRDSAFALGRMAERRAADAAAFRDEVPHSFRRVCGKRWRRLRKALRKAR